jgi:hypothetical protein
MDLSLLDDQVTKILRSHTFARKGQLKKLLQVLFANINSQDKLHPDFVIRELWPNETRTKRSTDVATEINRLRNALDAYYEDEGNGDPVTISLPNRSAIGSNGTHDRSWIVAEPRTAESRAVLARKRLVRGGWIAATLVLCSGLLVAVFVYLRFTGAQAQPRSARLEGPNLVVFNAEGKELWRKFFPDGLGPDWYYNDKPSWAGGPHIWFADLEGKGHQCSILLLSSDLGRGTALLNTDLLFRSWHGEMALVSWQGLTGT